MNNKIRNIISLMATLVFLVLALGSISGIPEGTDVPCGDKMNITAELLGEPGTDISQFSQIVIKVIDRETNEPLPNIEVGAAFALHYFVSPKGTLDNPFPCPNEGIMKALANSEPTAKITDANGVVEFFEVWVASYDVDRLIGLVAVRDPSLDSEYVPRETNIALKQEAPFTSFTISLLKIDSL